MTAPPRPFTSDEAELRVIGAALIDPQAIAKLTNLRADDFYLGSHRNIWDAIVDLGEAADWGTVSTWLERRSLLEEVQALTGPLDIYLAIQIDWSWQRECQNRIFDANIFHKYID